MVSGTGPDSHGDAELLSLWVAPDARGRGVGDALVEAVAGWAEAEGAMVLVLTVRATNAAAISLYRRHGFADAGSVTRPDGEPADLRMTRPLAHPVPRPS
ncbi:MAG: family N-acetyltransferase [Acidimicrobiaceae bacterium]|nr:family N-acetyltransferase [Acidimicrobiaceae bacterium]